MNPIETGRGLVTAWGVAIAALYMGWYTVFVSTNVLALAWIWGRETKGARYRVLAVLCNVLCLLTLGSTAMVGYTLQAVAPLGFATLIVFAAIANGLGLLAVMWAWWKSAHRAEV